ncbi:protein CFAP20DC isoform 3-T3 [Syngnathus typhle]
MFKHNYQGGAGVEVFSGQGKDPVAKWKLCGGPSAIRKVYDKEVKGFVYCLEGSSKTVKMQMPANGRMSLGLLQRFLAIQVTIPQGKDFSMELVITDVGHLKRRLYLSTVHKELSATLWHAKLPLAGVQRNMWTTLFVDLVSFTGELFKAAEFLSLDGITLFASCKVRRIFTMKTEPTGLTNYDMFFSRVSVVDQIPRSCQFPPNVCHECQLLNMVVLRKANLKTTHANADGGPDQHPAARSASSHRSKPQAAPHTASGSKAAAPATHAGRKGGPAANGMEKGEPYNDKTAYFNPTHPQFNAQVGDAASSHLHQAGNGAPSSLHPPPPRGKVLNKQPFERRKSRVQSAAVERFQTLLEPAHVSHSRRNETRETYSRPSSGLESRQEVLTPKGITEVLKADECSFSSPGTSSISPPPTPAEPPPDSSRPASSPDPQVQSCWESNDEEPELRLALREEVFTFASPSHSPKRGQGRGERKMETRGEQVQCPNGTRSEAQPEDDFIGSESDEEKSYSAFPQLTINADSTPDISQYLDPNLDLTVQPEDQRTEQTSVEDLCPVASEMQLQSPCVNPVETVRITSGTRRWPFGTREEQRCGSGDAEAEHQAVEWTNPVETVRVASGTRRWPFDTREDERCGSCDAEVEHQAVEWTNSVSLSRSCLQEISMHDPVKEEDNTIQPADSGDWHTKPVGSLQLHDGDDDELQMLASLKREQEEDEYKASGLTASQIHQCNVNVSLSSEDASTWTRISTPDNQGHHYQKEMNPLQCSKSRDWMDELSPRILPPSSKRRSDNTSNRHEDLIRGGDESGNEEEMEDEYLNLLYDPCLNCYFDPETGKYYELA